ncbi:unnamed protein product [Urochloa humidicola]
MASSIVADEPLVHVAFNRDATHLVAATASGIRVFSCSPSLEHVFSRSGFASPDGSPAAGEVTAADLVAVGPSGSSLVAVVFGDTIRYWSERPRLHPRRRRARRPPCREPRRRRRRR